MTIARMTVSPERWKELDENERTWLIYDTLTSFDKRLTKVEQGGWLHKGLAFTGGVVGGAAVFLGFRWGGLR